MSSIDYSTASKSPGSLSHRHVFPSKIGWVVVVFRQNAIQRLSFGFDSAAQAISAIENNPSEFTPSSASPGQTFQGVADDLPEFAQPWFRILREFADGHPHDLSPIPIDIQHLSSFGRRVSQACREIPWGETVSYRQLAEAAGSPGAARAVGTLMARNRFPLIVPCHRVLGASGQLTGFSAPGGLATKQALLQRERPLPLWDS